MDLKDIIQQDLEYIFFNESEFAEKVNFCGIDIVAIKSVQTYKDKYLKYSAEQGIGTYKNGIAITFKQKDLEFPPETRDEVEVDGITMFVVDVEKIKTLTYRIFLERIDG